MLISNTLSPYSRAPPVISLVTMFTSGGAALAACWRPPPPRAGAAVCRVALRHPSRSPRALWMPLVNQPRGGGVRAARGKEGGVAGFVTVTFSLAHTSDRMAEGRSPFHHRVSLSTELCCGCTWRWSSVTRQETYSPRSGLWVMWGGNREETVFRDTRQSRKTNK